VYLVTRQHDDDQIRVEAAWHPRHTASVIGYDVDFSEVNRLSVRLYDEHLSMVAQIHTHPGGAFHSSRDDGLPFMWKRGFVSIVLPNFGRDGIEALADIHVSMFDGQQWQEAETKHVLIFE